MVVDGGGAPAPRRRSRLADLADETNSADGTGGTPPALGRSERSTLTGRSPLRERPGIAPPPPSEAPAFHARRAFDALLEEFRRTEVLVPVDPYGGLWTADFGRVRWICAFSDEEALARFAFAQGDARRAWAYRTALGAWLLDEMVPELGAPAGVALDAGGDDGMLFPPVAGVVPDEAAVDLEEAR